MSFKVDTGSVFKLGIGALDTLVQDWREKLKVNSCKSSSRGQGQFLDKVRLTYPKIFRENGGQIMRCRVGLRLMGEMKPILTRPCKIPPVLRR